MPSVAATSFDEDATGKRERRHQRGETAYGGWTVSGSGLGGGEILKEDVGASVSCGNMGSYIALGGVRATFARSGTGERQIR